MTHIQQGVHVHGAVVLSLDVHALPPGHLVGLLDQVVTHPAGDGHDGHALLNEVGLPADTAKHVAHLIADLVVARLTVRARGGEEGSTGTQQSADGS